MGVDGFMASPKTPGTPGEGWDDIISPKSRQAWISPRSNERLRTAVVAYKEKTDKCHALAIELRERGLHAEAVRVLQRLWELDKDRPVTLVEMATALAAQGLYGEAAARIVEYAEVLASRGLIEDAQQAYESVLRKAAEDACLSTDIMRSYLRFCVKYQVGSGMKLLSEVCTDDGALAALAHATQQEGMHTTAISLHQELFLRCVCDNAEARAKGKDHLIALTEMYQSKHQAEVDKLQAQISDLKEAFA